jgi:hypothetical protein
VEGGRLERLDLRVDDAHGCVPVGLQERKNPWTAETLGALQHLVDQLLK